MCALRLPAEWIANASHAAVSVGLMAFGARSRGGDAPVPSGRLQAADEAAWGHVATQATVEGVRAAMTGEDPVRGALNGAVDAANALSADSHDGSN